MENENVNYLLNRLDEMEKLYVDQLDHKTNLFERLLRHVIDRQIEHFFEWLNGVPPEQDEDDLMTRHITPIGLAKDEEGVYSIQIKLAEGGFRRGMISLFPNGKIKCYQHGKACDILIEGLYEQYKPILERLSVYSDKLQDYAGLVDFITESEFHRIVKMEKFIEDQNL